MSYIYTDNICGYFQLFQWILFIFPLGVAYILTNEAKVFDAATLAAALLHDTVEDTKTTLEEIKEQFGQEVLPLSCTLSLCLSLHILN